MNMTLEKEEKVKTKIELIDRLFDYYRCDSV